MSEFSPVLSSMVGEVIVIARNIEFALRQLSGTDAAGIHALAESIIPRLPETLIRQLHYIASVRNRAAHEKAFVLSPEEFEHFKKCAAGIMHELHALQVPLENSEHRTAVSSSENTEKELTLAVEREMFERIAGKVALLGFFPVIGVIYLFCMLLYTLLVQGWLLLLAVVLACSVVMGIKGWQSPADRGLLYIALGAFAVEYVILLVLCFRVPVRGIPKYLGIIPGVNGLYLPVRWLSDLQWGKFLTAIAGIGLWGLAVLLFCNSLYKYALAAAAGSWVSGVAAAMLWGKKHEK